MKLHISNESQSNMNLTIYHIFIFTIIILFIRYYNFKG